MGSLYNSIVVQYVEGLTIVNIDFLDPSYSTLCMFREPIAITPISSSWIPEEIFYLILQFYLKKYHTLLVYKAFI